METTIQKRPRIQAIQALRGIACIAVMVSHTGIYIFGSIGRWGVSIFYILSGYMMVYSYYGMNRIEKVSVVENFKFSWNRIKGLYPLHVITTLIMCITAFVGTYREPLSQFGLKILLNLLLVQEWLPLAGRSFNGVAWYLCVTAFCYFLFPWVIYYFEHDYFQKRAWRHIIVLYIAQVLAGVMGNLIFGEYSGEGFWDSNREKWFIYNFPLARSIDFLIGCNVGYLFIVRTKGKKKYSASKERLLTIVAVIAAIAANVLCIIVSPIPALNDTAMNAADVVRWWEQVLIFTPSSCLIVALTARKHSFLSRVISHRGTIYIGNISQYVFLIHYVVYKYLNSAMVMFTTKKFVFYYAPWIKITIGTLITLIATVIWTKMIHKPIKY